MAFSIHCESHASPTQGDQAALWDSENATFCGYSQQFELSSLRRLVDPEGLANLKVGEFGKKRAIWMSQVFHLTALDILNTTGKFKPAIFGEQVHQLKLEHTSTVLCPKKM